MVCMKCKEEIPDESIFCMYCGKKQQRTDAPKPMKRSNGTGSVYRMSGRRRKPWRAVLCGNTIGCYERKSDALDALERIRQSGIGVEKINYTLGDVYEMWKAVYFSGNVTKSSREDKQTAWNRLKALSDRKMRDLKTSDYQRVVDTAVKSNGEPLSRSGKVGLKKLASQLCKQAMRDDIINKNYASFVVMPEDDNIEKGVFTSEQIQKLWGVSSSSRPARIVLLLIYTGLRINELFDLKRTAVDTERWCLIGGSKTAAGKDRYIPIPPKIRTIAQGFLDEGSDWFVAGADGTRTIYGRFRLREFYPLLDKLGIPYEQEDGKRFITPHCTRHTFFNLLRQLGADKDLVKLVMGHTDNTDSLGLYGHATEEDYARIDKIMSDFM